MKDEAMKDINCAIPARADAPIGEPTDAQRMDWLEAHLSDANGIYLDGAAIVHPFAFDRETIGCGTLRAAIDAAMGATPIAAPAGQPAEGYKLVPLELASRVAVALEAGCIWAEGSEGHPRLVSARDDFRAMLAAAPSVGQPATSSEAAPALDPNRVQICRVAPIAYDNGQPCNCPKGICRLGKGGLPSSEAAPAPVVPAGTALLAEADKLVRIAWAAMSKLGLRDRGSDIGLSHEVRMFALEFSEEGRDGPGALQIRGTGRALKFLRDLRAAAPSADRAAPAAQAVEVRKEADHG